MFAKGDGARPAPGTLNAIFFDAIRSQDKPDAILHRVDGRWVPLSHRDILERVRRIALGLRTLDVRPGDRVVLFSENRPEWALVDWACLASGVVDVPLYATLPAEQLPYLVNDSGAVVVFTSSPEQAEKVASIRAQAPALRRVVVFDDAARAAADMTLAELESAGAALDDAAARERFEREALTVQPDDLATIIYTSGTTGPPKGVMLSHDNVHSNVMATRSILQVDHDIGLSFLPLSHIFQRMGDYWFFNTGTTIAYVSSFDLVPLALQEVRPTITLSTPRVYEKFYARVLENALSGGAVRKRIFFWARAVGDRWATATLAGARRRRGPRSATPSRNASSSPGCASGWAGGSASSSPAGRRWPPKSRASSTRRDCPSTRDTA